MTMAFDPLKSERQDDNTSRVHNPIARLSQERTIHRPDMVEKSKPLRLLDLPFDVLQGIVKEVTHTNDLTALALTHSTLHSLVVPYIYSRFDIVWPEANPTVESRVGVDALTYGLATLVMAHDVLGEASYQQRCQSCQHCLHHQPPRSTLSSPNIPIRVRRGNYFAQYTRKFSLGNGPPDWVSEYLITKEGGKMLGTLVALALGRMRNLEAFVWDMPTGVLRDVWLALASLGNRDDGQDCRLDRVWVRWHDNRDSHPLASPPPPGAPHHANMSSLLNDGGPSYVSIPHYPTYTYPTFSILSPLSSISCLDVDEKSYVEELSYLVDRSLHKLTELRLGVATHAQRALVFRPAEDRSPVPPPFMTGDERPRPGGILGILVSRFCHAFSMRRTASSPVHLSTPVVDEHAVQAEEMRSPMAPKDAAGDVEVNQLGELLTAQTLQDNREEEPLQSIYGEAVQVSTPRRATEQILTSFDQPVRENQSRKLRLTTFEMERVYLSIPVLSRALDWSRLESLTLLGCMNHEQLWKALRRTFTPVALRVKTPLIKTSSVSIRQRNSSAAYNTANHSEYKLNIRRLHTDTVSRSLLAFIKDTLAPDSLEWLFLQETNAYKSTVTIDDIYRLAVRRHRGSLRKLLIDSELRNPPIHHDRERERDFVDANWRRWVSHQDLITCITSGKMQLKELSISIDYKHWHYFLQRLPNATGLRSLHISHVAEHPYGRSFDPREVALQVLDIISLKPDIELCYLGVERKCFEILEYKSNYLRRPSPSPSNLGTIGITTHTMVEHSDDEDHDEGGAANHIGHHLPMDDSDEDGENWDMNSNATSKLEETDEDDEADEDNDGQQPNQKKAVFRLREILFYDDKISIFKARHGKL